MKTYKTITAQNRKRKAYKSTVIFLMALFAVCALVIFSDGFSLKANGAASGFVRVHIRANSNSLSDQALKLSVRDAIINRYSGKLSSLSNKTEAQKYLSENIGDITRFVNEHVKSMGFDYTCTARLVSEEFPQKNYGLLTLEQGEYAALRVDIGEAAGKNWWCVLYPPLCFVNVRSDGESPNENKSEDKNALEVRSFIAKLFDK